MKRRTFVQSVSLGALGLGCPSFMTSTKAPSGLKISLTPWSLIRAGYGGDDPNEMSVFDFPKAAKNLGFDYIDHEMFHLPKPLKDEHLELMNSRCKAASVKSAVLLTGGAGDLGDADKSERKKALNKYQYWIDVAAALNCKAMRNVCADFITISYDEKLKYTAEGVYELGIYAKSKGIDLLIENHNGYTSDPEWLAQLMEKVNLSNVGVLGDFSNWRIKNNPEVNYPNPYKGIEILAPYIRAVSAKSEEFTPSGEESRIDYKKMLAILKKAPQLEFAGVEFFGTKIPRNQGATLTKDLIEKYW
jgi:L-ribulose-5-phosphate 3-epimerase